jgi:hypothetical protein
MSRKNILENGSSKSSSESSKDKTLDKASRSNIVAEIEMADGNAFKQIADFFKITTSNIPLVFYEDRMEIERGNIEATMINRAVFGNTRFIFKYWVNKALFNDPGYVRTVKKATGRMLPNGTPEVIEEKVSDPRHIFIPVTDIFHRQCKTINRKDGLCLTVFKSGEPEIEGKAHPGRRIGSLTQDGYMRATKITSSTASGAGIDIPAESVEEVHKNYEYYFLEPMYGKINQKIKLADLCTICSNFSRHKCETTNLMVYPNGFRMKGGEVQAIQDYGWGVYKDVKVIDAKKKLVIGGADTKFHNFGVPLDFIKALSKLQTIAGNAGIAVVYAHDLAMQIILPISIFGELIITIIPPEDEDEEPTESKREPDEGETS